MKGLNREHLIQFIKFGIVGASNTFVSLAVYYAVLWINRNWYLIGSILGWGVSVANAYFWNRRYVFQTAAASVFTRLKELGKTYLSYGATFLLSTILLYLEVEMAGWPAAFSPLINLLLTIPLNFLLNKFWTFKGN